MRLLFFVIGLICTYLIFSVKENPDHSTLLCLLLLVLFTIVIPQWAYYNDKENWNYGICTKCKRGYWKSFDMDSGGGIGYKCSDCGYKHWQNGWYNKEINEKYIERNS